MVATAAARVSTRAAWLTLVAAALASMMDGIDATGLAVANPALARDLSATLPQLEALTVGYMLAMAVALIPAGRLADRVGHRTVFLTALTAFAVSSLLVGFAGSATSMAVWRVVQGIAGALLAASALSLLRHAFTPERFKVAIGFFGAGLAAATLVGPFVGGVLVQYVSWRAIFFVNVPIAAVAFALAIVFAPRRTGSGDRTRFDVAGIALLALALSALVSGITRVPTDGWSGVYPVTALVLSAALLVAFVIRERAAAAPLLPLALFRSQRLVIGLAAILVAGLVHFGTAFYYALYLQQIRGLTPLQAGASLLPLIGLFVFGAPLSGLLNKRYGPRLPIGGGLLLLAAGQAGLAFYGLDSPLVIVVAFLLPMGLGIGLVMPSATELVVGSAPVDIAGVAAGLQQTVLMVSGTLGAAIFGSVIAASAPGFAGLAIATSERTGFIAGFGHAATLGLALALVVGVIVAFLPHFRNAPFRALDLDPPIS